MDKQNSIWKNKQYTKFFCSFTLSNIGDWFDFFALQIIFAHQFMASPMVLSSLLVIYMAPMAFLGMFSGIIADRFNKKIILISTDILSGLATIGLILSPNMYISLVAVFLDQ